MDKTGINFGGNWTEQKLDCVSKYLSAYTTIMSRYEDRFTFAYIDAFAGTGYRKVMLDEDINENMFPELDSQEVINFRQGSVRNALEVHPPFDNYIFIEENVKNYSELEKLKEEYPNKSIDCKHTDANEYFMEVCNKNWRKHRALVFLDPFGMQVEWNTIEIIAKTKAIDLWLLFPIGTVNRLLKRNGDIRESIREKLNVFFGEDGWYDVFYNLAYEHSLFGEDEQWIKIGNIFDQIESYLMNRLQQIFSCVATNPLALRNSKNVPLYLLCFAAENETAVKIADDILFKQLSQPYISKLL